MPTRIVGFFQMATHESSDGIQPVAGVLATGTVFRLKLVKLIVRLK